MRNFFVFIFFLTVVVNVFFENVNGEALNRDAEIAPVYKPLRNSRKAGQKNIQETQRLQYNVFGLLMVPS